MILCYDGCTDCGDNKLHVGIIAQVLCYGKNKYNEEVKESNCCFCIFLSLRWIGACLLAHILATCFQ